MKTFRRTMQTLASASLLSLVIALAPTAFAATIQFDGAELGGQHWGMSQTTFNAIKDDFQVFDVDASGLGSALGPIGPYDITQGDVFKEDGSIFEAVDAMANPVFANSPWSAEANKDLDGRNFLVFATVMPNTPFNGAYQGPEVGLDILPEDGWVLLQTSVDMMGSIVDFYYAALLTEDLGMGEEVDFDIVYNITRDGGLPFDGEDFVFPQFGLSHLGPDSIIVPPNPIPEPGSALLIGLGIAGLAARRKQAEV